ncbi:hypothetical protein R1sor_007350 [Riccia sorocarpa]|uniref:Endonuclease/exonuclease/phosphatase domain-containing protein n=1 Tax=Riccia sorocarpa TaxID=122646 RepID=A0ABD3HSV3_9MARC
MEGNIPADVLAPEELWSILDSAEVLKEPIRSEATVAVETNLTSELQGRGSWKNARVELQRDLTEQHRKKYKTLVTPLRDDRGIPVWAQNNCRSAPPHTAFGTLLEGYDGFYRAGIEVGVGGFNFADIPTFARATQESLDNQLEAVQLLLRQSMEESAKGTEYAGLITSIESKMQAAAADTRRAQEGLFQDLTKVVAIQEAEEKGKVRQSLELLEGQINNVNLKCAQSSEVSAEVREQVKLLYAEVVKNNTNEMPQRSVHTAMEELESRMRGYVEAAKNTQHEVLQEREQEARARQARSLNLRLRGIEEEEGEITQEVVHTFFQETLRVSGVQVGQAVQDKTSTAALVFAYFAPAGAPVYDNLDGEDPFLAISRVVTQIEGACWVFGDFNSRTESLQSSKVSLDPLGEDCSNEVWKRDSADQEKNRLTTSFMQFVEVCDLTILNGIHKFPESSGYTYIGETGQSVVDYLLASNSGRERVRHFKVEAQLPESDHCALWCSIEGFSKNSTSRKGQYRPGIYLDKSLRDQYKQKLALSLQQAEPSSDGIAGTIADVARSTFGRKQRGDSRGTIKHVVTQDRLRSQVVQLHVRRLIEHTVIF